MKVAFRLALLVCALLLTAQSSYADGEFCPAQPTNPDGTTIAAPAANAVVTSPFTVSGNYFGSFEGVVPIRIFDEDGNLLVQTQANNECCVLSPYSTQVSFSVSEPTPACLIVLREDASGMTGGTPLVQIPITLSPVSRLPDTGADIGVMGWLMLLVPVLLLAGIAFRVITDRRKV